MSTQESANEKKLQQDHPCLIHLIQNGYIRKPAPRSSPYHLDNWQKTKDPSDGQSQAILRILRNQVSEYFLFLTRNSKWSPHIPIIFLDKRFFHRIGGQRW